MTQADGHSGGLLQRRGKGPVQLRPGSLGAVHIPGQPHGDLPHLVLPGQPDNVRHGFVRISAGYHLGGAHNGAQQIRNGHAGSGVAVVDSHNSHFCSSHLRLPPLYHKTPEKESKKIIDKAKPL